MRLFSERLLGGFASFAWYQWRHDSVQTVKVRTIEGRLRKAVTSESFRKRRSTVYDAPDHRDSQIR